MRSSLVASSRIVVFVALAAPTGCGKAGGSSSCYPVQGEVFVNGQPAANASIVFYPKLVSDTKEGDRAVPAFPAAEVRPDGTFELTTFRQGDGAPPGDYVVTIIWAETYRDEGETLTGPDKLRGRYADPIHSPLNATVTKGKNQLPRFDLQ